MSPNKSRIFGLLALSLLALAVVGCNTRLARTGPLQNMSETVELGAAESAEVEIDMGAGELEVSGGATALMEADFAFNVEEVEPEISYDGGRLLVRQGNLDDVGLWAGLGDFKNQWDLRLSDEVPMTMNVNVGGGTGMLALGSLALSELDVNVGAGEVVLDLTGQPSLSRLDLSMGAGKVTVDLSGEWSSDLTANIDGGAGELIVRLPSDVGVRVAAETGLGDIDSGGLTRDGDYYVNDAYGESAVTLTITIEAGLGQVTLETE